MGWLLLIALTVFAAIDAVGLALRTEPRGRAELGIGAASFFALLLGAPVLVLGYANVLRGAVLAAVSLAAFGTVFWMLSRQGGARRLLVSCTEGLRELATLPLEALRESFRARSIVFVGLLVAGAFIGASLVLTYLVEFCRWDDEIYHTPIVGWAIQHHGFSIVDLPKPSVGGTNGYPRLCESLSLWFVIFTDKTLLELPATLFAAPVLLCVYALARRFTDRVCAMGLAVVLLLVPHALRQFCSSYVDMEMAFFLLAATYWATRLEHRFADTLLCAVAMGLAAASKTTWLLFVPPLAVVDYARLIRQDFASRRRDVVLAVAASIAFVSALGGLCFIRNWLHYGNPVWPVAYDIPKLGIHLPGIYTPADYAGHDPPVVEGFEVPKGGMHDVMRHGYGLAIMWIAGPLGFAAMALWALAFAFGVLRRAPSESVMAAGSVVFLCLVWLVDGPNFGQPRYNLHVVGVLLVMCAWVLRGARQERLREGLLGAMLVLSIVPLFWMRDANYASLEEERERLSHPFAPRAYTEHPSFDLLERQKEDELHAGDGVVFSDGIIFPGLLWNFEFSNRVDYVAFTGAREFFARVAALDPKWLCVGGGTPARTAIEQSGQWLLVGPTTRENNELAFRRKENRNGRGAGSGP